MAEKVAWNLTEIEETHRRCSLREHRPLWLEHVHSHASDAANQLTYPAHPSPRATGCQSKLS